MDSQSVPTTYRARFALRMLFTFGPTLQAMVLVWALGHINLLWSSIFGIGGYLVEWSIPHPRHSPVHLFGLLVWPALCWAGLHSVSGWVLRLRAWPRTIAIGAYLASLCIVVPMDGILYGPVKYEEWPLFIRLFAD